jgi:inner membrane protein involved in colicin E2 resistance
MPIKTAKKPTAAQRRLDFDQVATAPATVSLPVTRKREAEAEGSPVKKKAAVAAVTPEEELVVKVDGEQEAKELSKYVPKYIHANVGYKTKGTATLPDTTIKAYDMVAQHFEIPVDLEQRRAHGPLSGSSYEERVLQEYELNKLTPKREGTTVALICTCCAEMGHKRNDCPTLI